MAALAFKALSYGADKIPDRVFESLPGGFFTPEDKKKSKSKSKSKPNPKDNKKDFMKAVRTKSEERYNDRSSRRHSHRGRNRSPSTEYSGYSTYDDTDYEERDYRDRRRRRAKSLGGRDIGSDRSPSPQRHSRRSTRNYDDRDSDAEMANIERGPQFSPSPTEYRPYNPADYVPGPVATGVAAGNGYYGRRDSSARPEYNTYPPQPNAHSGAPHSSFAARYTPGDGYAPSPVNASFPPPESGYAPYNPADYVSQGPAPYATSRNAYPSPPPFYRHPSHSQPVLPGIDDQTSYNDVSRGHRNSSSSHYDHHDQDKKSRRSRSAGHHHRSRSRITDGLRSRFDGMNLDEQDKRAAASTVGALAGGLTGAAMGKGTLSTVLGVAVGSYGARQLEKMHEKK